MRGRKPLKPAGEAMDFRGGVKNDVGCLDAFELRGEAFNGAVGREDVVRDVRQRGCQSCIHTNFKSWFRTK